MIHSLEEIDPTLLKEKQKFEELFSTSIARISVDVKSKEEFTALGRKEWVTAFADPTQDTIVIVKQEESGKTSDEWRKTLVHEMVHLFWDKKVKAKAPVWLSEGVAYILAGQRTKKRNITIKDLIDHFSESNKETYAIGYNAVRKMLEEEK